MQVAGRSMHRLVCLISVSAFMIAVMAASAEDVPQTQHHQADSASHEGLCKAAIQGPGSHEGLESVQVETSDITRYEQFFESVLHRPVVQQPGSSTSGQPPWLLLPRRLDRGSAGFANRASDRLGANQFHGFGRRRAAGRTRIGVSGIFRLSIE